MNIYTHTHTHKHTHTHLLTTETLLLSILVHLIKLTSTSVDLTQASWDSCSGNLSFEIGINDPDQSDSTYHSKVSESVVDLTKRKALLI